jgi:hypothetical protein
VVNYGLAVLGTQRLQVGDACAGGVCALSAACERHHVGGAAAAAESNVLRS